MVAAAPRVSIGKFDEILVEFRCQVMQYHREVSAVVVDIVVEP